MQVDLDGAVKTLEGKVRRFWLISAPHADDREYFFIIITLPSTLLIGF